MVHLGFSVCWLKFVKKKQALCNSKVILVGGGNTKNYQWNYLEEDENTYLLGILNLAITW